MASEFKQVNDRVIQGEGDPAAVDALVTQIGTFPIGTIYINNSTGKLFSRNAAAGELADWVSQSGGSGETPGIDDVLAENNDAGTALIKNVGDPVDDQDVVTKKYYDDNLPSQQTFEETLVTGSELSEDRAINLATFTLRFMNGILRFSNVPEFANNAAALSGGLSSGSLYYTDVSGDLILKIVASA